MPPFIIIHVRSCQSPAVSW